MQELASIENVVSNLLVRSRSQVKVKLASSFPGGRLVGGKYHLGTHTITLFIEEIKKQCLQLFHTDVDFLSYLAIVLSHEIGHAEDGELVRLSDQLDHSINQFERDRLALEIEENAWHYAALLLEDIDTNLVDTVIYHSLRPYRDKLQMEIV